jgi:hypothetical protein
MTNEAAGEPTVLVDSQRLRMAQGIDGNWYGYFGDKTDLATVDGYADELFFGTNQAALNGSPVTVEYSDMVYLGIPSNGGVIDNPPTLSNWNATSNAKCDACGQILQISADWPFTSSCSGT